MIENENIIVINKEGLDDEALARVLVPISNNQQCVGITVAAEKARSGFDDSSDDDLIDHLVRTCILGKK